MENLFNLLRQLIVIFFDLENGETISLKNRRDIMYFTYNIQANKSNCTISNEIVLAIKKFENELFTDSLISYVCILNLLKYFKDFEITSELSQHLEIQKMNYFIMNMNENFDNILSLKDMIGDIDEAKKYNFNLITSRSSHAKYIIDIDNNLWIVNEVGMFKELLENVKYISNSNGLLVGLDTDGKFWQYSKDSLKKEYVEEVIGYTFDRMYDLPGNKHLLITNDETNIVINLSGFSITHEKLTVPLKRIVDVTNNYQLTVYIGDEGIVYSHYDVLIKSNFLNAYIGPKCLMLIDTFGDVHRRELEEGVLVKLKLPEKIKKIAFSKYGAAFLSYTGNVYCQFDEYFKMVLVANDVESIHEIFDGILLVNKEETRIVKFDSFDSKIKTEKYKIHYGKLV